MKEDSIGVKDTIISGFALFAIFFGAGNLILPPYIGLHAGQNWIQAWIGFALSGPGLTCLGMVAMAKNQGDTNLFAGKVGAKFSVLLGSIIILCIGPLMSVPRTGATTYEVSIQPYFPNFNPILFAIIFFGITLYFAMNKSRAIDIIGTYMTPVLLIILLFILIKGILTPINPTTVVGTNQFSLGFIEGYHTMDSLSPMVLAGMIISNFREKGIESKEALTKHTIYAEIIAATGLVLVYGGLVYLGSKAFAVVPSGLDRSQLLNMIVHHFLGGFGNIALGIVVALACLTTSIGLITATGDFFNKVSKDKLKYHNVVIVSVVVSGILSIVGVEGIMAFSEPILVSVYPVVIVLTFLNLFDQYVKDDLIYKVVVYSTLVVSIVSGIEAAGFKNLALVKLFSNLPLWNPGFGWIIISFIGLIVGLILSKITEEKNVLN